MIKLSKFAFAPLAAAAIAVALPAMAQQAQPVQFGLVAKLAFSWPTFIADEKKLFEGFKPEFTVVGQSAKVIQGIAGGTFAMGHAGIPEAIRSAEQGAPVKIIASEVAVPPYHWLASKNIKKVEDLKGKKMMLGGTKDITFIYWKTIAEKHGLKMTDFDFVYSGSTTNRFSALISGAVDGTILGQPFDFQAMAQGFNVVAQQKTYSPNAPFTVYAVNTEWAAKNKGTVVAFLKGYMKGVNWLYDPANRKDAIELLIKHSGAKPDDAEKTYDFYVKELKPFRADGAMTDAAMKDALDALVVLEDLKAPTPPASKYYDDSFLKAAR